MVAVPNISYPGVYIQEVPSGVHTITGVATSIAAFLGRTQQGPLNKAVRILSPSDFTRTYVRAHSASDLAQSVQQFFANGGNDCYVVRLAGEGALKASVGLKNIAGLNVLKATAKSEGTWGNSLRLVIDYDTPNPDDTFNLQVHLEELGKIVTQERFINLSMDPDSPRFAPLFVSQASNLIDVALDLPMEDLTVIGTTPAGYSQSRRPFAVGDLDVLRNELNNLFNTSGHFQISINGREWRQVNLSTFTVTGGTIEALATEIEAEIIDQIGTNINVSWDPIREPDLRALRLTSDMPPHTGVCVRRAPRDDLAGPLMMGINQGGIETARYSNMRPAANGAVLMAQTSIDLLAGLPLNAITHIHIDSVPFPAGVVTLPSTIRLSDTEPDDTCWYQEPDGGYDGLRKRLNLIVQMVNGDHTSPWQARLWGYHLAFVRTEGAAGRTTTCTTSPGGVFSTEPVANLRKYSLGDTTDIGCQTGGETGLDGNAPTAKEYIGDEAQQTGLYALDGVDLFNLMVLPGDRDVGDSIMEQVVGQAGIYCRQRRAFLLLDAPSAWTNGNNRPVATRTEVDGLRQLVESDHAAVFYPSIEYSDAGLKKRMGPSGLIAGLIARIDSTRGVWKAPAGIEANLRGILDLQVNLTDGENGVLNKLGVNCLRKFPNGFVNWGARTLAGSDEIGSEWKYIPIRRLALFLEESLYRGTKWVVFEPNDEPLWAQIRLNLNAFMMDLFRRGAFQGSTPELAFFVKCDGETTTQNDRNVGIVNIEVGFAPLKPAEFVVIRIQQMAGE